jgi:hypothetical protein
MKRLCIAAFTMAFAFGCGGAALDSELTPDDFGSVQQGLILAATGTNISILVNGTYDGGKHLAWSGGGSSLAVPGCAKRLRGDDNTQIDDYQCNDIWGQCVSFVKAVTHSTATTGLWTKGANVVKNGNVQRGEAIAVFYGSYGSYNNANGHAAIFDRYTYSGGTITGFYAWDQNWNDPVVRRHHFSTAAGGGKDDANSYNRIVIQ